MHNAKSVLILQLFLVMCAILLVPSPEKEVIFVPKSTMALDPVITGQLLQAEIKNMVLNVQQHNEKLLEGVKNVYVSQNPIDFLVDNESFSCSASHILGAHSHGTIIISDAGYETNKHTLYHELGHHLWDNLPQTDKEAWTVLFEQTESFLTQYAKTNPNENFAENVACYFTNYRSCAKNMVPEKVRFVEHVT